MSATIGHEENQYLTMAAAAGPVPSANRQRLGTPSGHRGRRPGSGASSGTDYIATLIEELQISVAEGDLEKSTAAVRQLVAHRTSLSIALNTSPPSTDPRYQEITVKIHVEDKETTAPPFFWTLKTNTTVLQLKRKMLTEHGFPMQVQRWIIGRRIAKDDDTLYRCGVTADGTSIFLYLISAASIGLVKQEFLADNKKPLPSGTLDDTIEENIYMSIHRTDSVGLRDSVADNLTGVPSPSPDASKSEHPPPLPPRNQPELDQLDNPNDLGDRPNKPPAPDVQYHQSASSQRALLTAENIPPPAPAEGYQDVPGILQQPETTSIAPAGWQCPLCTFVNEPTRPGCEACTSPRPDDYVVPDHYEMSEREKERIRNERELDKLSEQLQRGERGEHQLEMTPLQLGQVLQLNDRVNKLRRQVKQGETIDRNEIVQVQAATQQITGSLETGVPLEQRVQQTGVQAVQFGHDAPAYNALQAITGYNDDDDDDIDAHFVNAHAYDL